MGKNIEDTLKKQQTNEGLQTRSKIKQPHALRNVTDSPETD